MKKTVCFLVIVLILATGIITVIAGSAIYNTTLPMSVFHKTLCSSTKSTTTNYGIHSTGNCESYFVCWIDGNLSGSWTLASKNYKMYANQSKNMSYTKFIPVVGSGVRLRCQGTAVFGGETVKGTMNFK